MIRCSRMPKRSHQTARRDKPNIAHGAANGTPLSVRIAAGRPKSRKVRSNTEKAKRDLVDSRPSQASRYLER